MNSQTINIAYAVENEGTAKKMTAKLSSVNIAFKLISSEHLEETEETESFLEPLLQNANPCLLLLSDNFLKSVECMGNSLTYFQKLIKNEQVLPIIIDGVYTDENGNQQTVQTEFERVSNVIKYMNFWQEKYLEMRKLKRSIPTNEAVEFNQKLKIIRTISSEIGEFLRYLRDTNYYSLEEFSANHFEVFFRNFGDETAYLEYSTRIQIEVEEVENLSLKTEETSISIEELIEPRPMEEEVSHFELPEKEALTETIIEEDKTEELLDNTELDLSNIKEVEANTEVMGELAWEQSEVDLENELEEEKSLVSIAENEERELTDTELLALELAQKLPNAAKEETTNNRLEEEPEEEEEMISLEDLLGEDLMQSTTDNVPRESTILKEPAGIEADVIVLADDKEIITNLDLFSANQNQVVEIASDVLDKKAVEMENEAEEDNELEGYVVDEEDSGEELEEFEVLQAANILVQSGKITEGISLLKETLKEAPEFLSVRYQYAAFLVQYQNNFTEAASQLALLLEQEPNNLVAKFFLGELAEVERDYLSAKNYFEKVVAENPEFPNVQYKLGMLLVNHLKESQEQAAQYFQNAYSLNTNNVNALYQLGVLQNEDLDQTDNAIHSFEKVLAQAPEHPFVNYDLALIYYNQEDKEKAYAHYESACTINPELRTEENDLAFSLEEIVVKKEEISLEVLHAEIEHKANLQLTAVAPVVEIKESESTNINGVDLAEENYEETEEEDSLSVPELESVGKTALKIALITGATSGIGKATAEIFAKNGYKLILTGRRFSRLFQLKEQFENAYESAVKLLPFDVRISADIDAALKDLPDDWRDIDILVNNAGLAKGFEPIHEGKLEDWETMIDTNVKGLLYMTRAIAPQMVKRKKGHIINICSIAGKEVYPNGGVYCATKFAVDALTKAMRLDLHKHNIRVSQVSPGHVEETEFSLVRYDGNEENAKKVYADFVPVNSRDVAEVIYFIVSRPAHVNIQDVLLMGSQQASALITDKSGR